MTSSSTVTPLSVARRGGLDILGISIGYAPMAMAIGAAIAHSQDVIAGWAGAPLIGSGTAHLTVNNMIAGGSGLGAAILAGLFINLRLAAFSAGLSSWFAEERTVTKLVIGFFTIDATYLLANQRFTSDDPGPGLRRWYMVGMGLVLWPTWSAATAVGIIAGAGLADDLPLRQVGILMIGGLLALNMQERMQVVAAASGAAAGLVALAITVDLAPILAAAVAIVVSTSMPATEADGVADPAAEGMAT